MSSTLSWSPQCHELVEALSKCVNSTRLVYEDDLSVDARNHRLKEGDDHLTSLVTALDPILLSIKKDRNYYVPINRLFNELLLEIWSYTDLSERFVISQVCHKWRQVALASTGLWTFVDLELNNTPRIRKLLERSGIAPLHIVTSIKKFYNPLYQQRSFANYNDRGVSTYNAYYPIYNQTGQLRKPIPFLPQKEFDDIFARSATLDAFIGGSRAYYVTPKSLATSMPHLKTLRLMLDQNIGFGSQDVRDSKPLNAKSLPFPIFEGQTPRLRELCFEWIHARWSDPIYRNLTNLRLFYPKMPPTTGQLIQVLGSCPDITHLELIGCLKPDISASAEEAEEYPNAGDAAEDDLVADSDQPKTVSLSKLIFFHMNDFEDDAIRDFLSCLILPCLDYLFVGAPSFACFTDKYGRPLKSLLPTIRRPKELRITPQIEYFLLFARIEGEEDASEGTGDCQARQRSTRRSGRKPWGERNGGYQSGSIDDCTWDWCYSPGLAVSSRRDQTNIIQTGVPDPKAHEIMSRWSATMLAVGVQLDQPFDHVNQVENTGSNDTSDVQQGTQATLAGDPDNTQPPSPTLAVPTDPPAREIHSIIPIVTEAIDFVEVMEQVSLGGLEFHAIEKLELSDSVILSDAAYRELFRRCRNLQKLKLSFNKGIGILQTIVKDELLPNLTELWLYNLEGFYGYSVPLSPTLLADWVELRQSAAKVRTGEDRIKMLERIVVVFSSYHNPATTEEEIREAKAARKRMRKALRNENAEVNKDDKNEEDRSVRKKLNKWERKLVWVHPVNNDAKMKKKWEELVNEDGYGEKEQDTKADKGATGADLNELTDEKTQSNGDTDKINEEDRKDDEKNDGLIAVMFEDEEKEINEVIKAEWPMNTAGSSPFRGWCAGPW